jgi:hypothetical protein
MGRDGSGSGSGRKERCCVVRCCAGAVLRWCFSGGSEVWLFGGMGGEGRGAGLGVVAIVAVVAVMVGRWWVVVEATRVGAAARRAREEASDRVRLRRKGDGGACTSMEHEHEHEQQSRRPGAHPFPFRLLPVRAAPAPRKDWCRPSGHAQPHPTVVRALFRTVRVSK